MRIPGVAGAFQDVAIFCEGGYCVGSVIYSNDGKEMKKFDPADKGRGPQANFINAVRSRKDRGLEDRHRRGTSFRQRVPHGERLNRVRRTDDVREGETRSGGKCSCEAGDGADGRAFERQRRKYRRRAGDDGAAAGNGFEIGAIQRGGRR